MSLDLTIVGTTIPTNLSSLKSFPAAKDLVFSLDSTLSTLLNSTLDQVPVSMATTKVGYMSAAQTWNPSDGPVTFGLQGGASGSLQIISTMNGPLVSYTDGLDSPDTEVIAVPPNVIYVALTLGFSISANAAGTYSGGAYGVTAAISTAETYGVTFLKAFAPSTVVRAALAQTFESFTLPLHSQTLSQMSDGDYLLHEFSGNLHLSFGAYAGLDKVLYAGQCTADVLKSFGSPLATFSGQASPTLSVGPSASFKFQYATRFEALLSKLGSAARMHLFRSSSKDTAATLRVGLSFDGGTDASITPEAATVPNGLVARAGGSGSPGGNAVAKVMSAAAGEINKYITEVNDKLTNWVDEASEELPNLQVAIESKSGRTMLAGYNFDLTSPQYPAAWRAAIGGDFIAALQTGAVTLDIGSGLEQTYQRRTSFTCNLFNLWTLSTWDQFASNVTLVYAGNNVFHLVAKIGRTLETDLVGAMHSLDFYFTAAADVKTAGQVSNVEIDLHLDLTAQSDPKAAGAIATILSAIEAGPAGDALARDMHAFATNSKQGTVQLKVTIPASAYSHINCDPYLNGKPQTNSTYNDAQNWAAFAQAADDLNAWPLRQMSTVSTQGLLFLKKFVAWEDLNMEANGASTPNRMQIGNAQNHWPSDFPQITDSGSRSLIVYSMLAGQSFMNFCEALHNLVSASDVNAAGVTWNGLVEMITYASKNYMNVDFLRPTALAIIRLSKSPALTISGPTGASVPTDHFAVTLNL